MIVQWFLILLKFDFMIVVKKGHITSRADHLSWMIHGEPLKEVDDDLPDAYLLNIEMVPKWSANWILFLTIGQIEIPSSMPNIETLSRGYTWQSTLMHSIIISIFIYAQSPSSCIVDTLNR